jgi:hypothetical protein
MENDMFYFLQSYKMSNYHGVQFTVYYNTANYFQFLSKSVRLNLYYLIMVEND